MLRLLAFTATCAALKVPVSVKDVANGIRDGLQSGLKSRNSRLSVELPPGAPLALQGDEPDDFSWFGKQETETAKVIKGDRALADFAALLFPSDFAVAAVYAAPEAARAAAASASSSSACWIEAAESISRPSRRDASSPSSSAETAATESSSMRLLSSELKRVVRSVGSP